MISKRNRISIAIASFVGSLTVLSTPFSVVHASEQNGQQNQSESKLVLDINNEEYQRELLIEAFKDDMANKLNRQDNKASIERQMDNKMPLSEKEIIEYRKREQQIERANNQRLNGPVKELYDTVNLDIEQNKPIKIKVVPGYLSTLTFFDSTGAPWPVEYAKSGNDTFSMEPAGKNNNVINVITSDMYADANASIGLVGMDTNFTITLVSNNSENTSKMSFRIPEPGPEANVEPVSTRSMVENAPSEMYDLINGRIYNLEGAKPMKVKGVDADAYLYNGFLYIISKHNLRSPAREASVSLPSGKHAYKIYPTSTLQFAVNGKSVFASVEKEIDRR